MDPAIGDAFHKYGVIRHYGKHEFVFHENEPPDAVYYVEDGLVKISQAAPEGHDITLFLRHPGETFGNAEALADVPRQRYARCLSDSRIAALETGKFRELARKNASFSHALAAIEARRLLQTQRFVETLISRPAAWRLAWFLMQLGKRKDGRIDVHLQLSHEEISYVIGCSRQTVTELLNRWRESGLIEYTKKKLTIRQADSFLADI